MPAAEIEMDLVERYDGCENETCLCLGLQQVSIKALCCMAVQFCCGILQHARILLRVSWQRLYPVPCCGSKDRRRVSHGSEVVLIGHSM